MPLPTSALSSVPPLAHDGPDHGEIQPLHLSEPLDVSRTREVVVGVDAVAAGGPSGDEEPCFSQSRRVPGLIPTTRATAPTRRNWRPVVEDVTHPLRQPLAERIIPVSRD